MPDHILEDKINEIQSEKNPLNQARLILQLRELHLVSNVRLASLLGVKPSHLSHLVRILRLPEIVLDGYASKMLSLTHLIIMSRVSDPDKLVSLYEEILARNLTIAQTEHRVREILYQVDSLGQYLGTDKLRMYEERLISALGAGKVKIVQTRIKCSITIELKGNLDLTSQYLEDIASRFRRKKLRSADVKAIPHVSDMQTDSGPTSDSDVHEVSSHKHETSSRYGMVEVPRIHAHSGSSTQIPAKDTIPREPPRYEKHTLDPVNDTDELGELDKDDADINQQDEVRHTHHDTSNDDEPIR